MESLKDTLAALRPRLLRPGSVTSSSHPLLHFVPTLDGLPAAALDQLECPACHGDGGAAAGAPCAPCLGSGIVCPTCRGAGWVRDEAWPIGDRRRLAGCPDCSTRDEKAQRVGPHKERRAATIQAFVRAAWADAAAAA